MNEAERIRIFIITSQIEELKCQIEIYRESVKELNYALDYKPRFKYMEKTILIKNND